MMQKYKSALLLGLLFCASWVATSDVQRYVSNWAYIFKIEGPSYWLGSDMLAISWALPLVLALVLWLQRDKAGRALATVGAGASLMLCIFNVQTALWFKVLLYSLSLSSPTNQALYSVDAWSDLIPVSIAFTLSALCLWLCARAAGPHQPRPVASWRDWLSWNADRSEQGKSLRNLPTSQY